MTKAKTIRSQKQIRSKTIIRINNTDAPAYAITWTTEDIIESIKQGKTKNPPYQRKLVWGTKPKMSPEFITTVLDGEMIDAMMLQESPTGVFHMLNCQQRFNTLKNFYENKFAIPKKIDPEREGLKFKTLTNQEQRNFLNHEFLIQVQVSKNGKGAKAYKNAQLGLQSSKQEIMRADYYKTNFFKYIQTLLKLQPFKDFFKKSGVLTTNAIARCEDEEFMGELLLLEVNGACDGEYYKQMLDEFSRKPFGSKKYNEFKKLNSHQKLTNHIRIVNRIFPKGLSLQDDPTGKLTKKQRNTRLGNKTAFYRLIGAIKLINAIEGGHDIFTDAKCKRIREKLPIFAKESGERGRAGNATGIQQRYYASTTRATTNKSIREIGITIIKDLIMSY